MRPPWVRGAMARISTGTGDDGTTATVGGKRVPKTSARIAANGAVDETNDALGLAASHATRPELRGLIRGLQADLFTLGADLSAPAGATGGVRVTQAMVDALVVHEDRLERALPPLRHFILPGGTPCAAALQLGRSLARRAEREAWRLDEIEGGVSRLALVYLNRLSDLLFLLAREENVAAGVEETLWMRQ
ncbi:MAG: cob(I)alamin adenosyltransferase [Thermoplasmata archaeon]|jgi:cob(I)alamin adenosyltransferase|nr:cob(I)alamin adenosyltransferase [Thermoplasmata archaeon]